MTSEHTTATRRVVIVTGAGAGLGRAYSLHLARDGLCVLVNNRRRVVDARGRGSADDVVEQIRAAGGEAVANYDDVAAEGAGERIVRQALDTWGRLDALVNNAGVAVFKPILQTTFEEWRHVLGTNLDGAFLCTQAAAPVMLRNGGGSVVNIASISGLRASTLRVAYGTSKGALIHLTKQQACELGKGDFLGVD